ncbi:heavy-metal-associated domain-containing protein [Acidimangrovimonas sediminis]|uniref:heavy-metal-associated domain-containing protein n=1 Tax=Acidimangrovimonas sediminis TaxID=2056283 RepID=UPI000C80951D|nr:heavy-metal-associated domain-containing protein [Acidimangrovimonas sediminis]
MTDLTLTIPDMSCGHCKAAVEGAVTGADPAAKVAVDLETKTAKVETALAPAQVLAALNEAGYPATAA